MKRYFMIAVFPVIWLITAPVFSDEPNPFREGTEKKTLTEEEKQSLLQYANTSKTTLERAKREAAGKPLQETLDIYVNAITSVVLKSFNEEKRRELLMRVCLNQALQLTVGIPTPDGKKIEEKGVLTNAPVDLTAAILENAIDLALSYYPKDKEAIEAGDLLKLPFFEYAAYRLSQAKSWLTGIHSWQLQLEFEKAILEQWKSSVLSDQNLERERVAPLILDVEEALTQVTLPQHTVSQKVRFLRGVIRQVLEDSARMVPDLRITTRIDSVSENEKGIEKKEISVGDQVLETYETWNLGSVSAISENGYFLLSNGTWYDKSYIYALVPEYEGISVGDEVLETRNDWTSQPVSAISENGYFFLSNRTWYDKSEIYALVPEYKGISVGDEVLETRNDWTSQPVLAISENGYFFLSNRTWYDKSEITKVKTE